MLLALLFPLVVFVYCRSHFQLDREFFLINMEIFPSGSFERSARMAADPTQIALFRLLFDSLRIQTPLDFVLWISMNASICYRFKHVVYILMETRKRLGPETRSDQRRPIVLLLLAFCAMILVYAHEAIASSKAACQAYPECVAYAYQWQLTRALVCPCIALTDANRVPTQEEWDHPLDVTATVRNLSISGRLQVLYLINRRLWTLPDQLQRCSDLRHM